MSRRFVAELKPGERVQDQIFLIRQKDLRTTAQGGLYIHAVLADRTGQLLSRMWQANEKVFQFMPEGGFMYFTGRCENYKGTLQFIIDGFRAVEISEVELSHFLPHSKKDPEAMMKRVREIIENQMRDPWLKELLAEFLGDGPLMEKFRLAPAAVQYHHAYLGGLLEHTLNLLEIALRVCPLYPMLSQDLVLAGLFLHDLAKTEEMGYQTNLSYTDEGQLVGHVSIAATWIELKARQVEARLKRSFPRDIKNLIQHIVLSHHGEYEFGAPKLPAIPEAIAVHYLDNLDAKINIVMTEIENDRDPDSHWTGYNRALETRIFKRDVMGVRSGAQAAGSPPPEAPSA